MSNFHPYPKPQPRAKKLFSSPMKKKIKVTGEANVFREIYRGQKGKSQISGEYIADPTATNFAHILAKGQSRYPLFKLRKDNIFLCLDQEHFDFDNGLHSELKKDSRWDWVFKKMEELKQEYKKLSI